MTDILTLSSGSYLVVSAACFLSALIIVVFVFNYLKELHTLRISEWKEKPLQQSLQIGAEQSRYTPGPEPKMDQEQVKVISARLSAAMNAERHFLKPGFTIRQLAEAINVQQYILSAYLNGEEGLNFNDYLNRFRVEYCQQLIQEGKAGELNLHGLSMLCGFKNRNTFTNAFKKFTGYTPSEYIRMQRMGQ